MRQHLGLLRSVGEVVSVAEGERRLQEDALDAPVFSIWFDDGLSGVKKHALPLLEAFGITAGLSICSRFVDGTEFFWRFKLAYLSSIDGMRFLRTRLRRHGFKDGERVRTFTLDNFSLEIRDYIDELFNRFTTAEQRADTKRMFLDRAAVQSLYDQGWTVANHTAGHYPVAVENGLDLFCSEFQECESEIRSMCGAPSLYWVIPFDYNTSPAVLEIANECRKDRYLVFVGNRRNTIARSSEQRCLYRIEAPVGSAESLLRRMAEQRA